MSEDTVRVRCPKHMTGIELPSRTFDSDAESVVAFSCGCKARVKAGKIDMQHEEGRKDDNGKLRMDLIPFGPLKDIAEVLTVGAKKYTPNNWQLVKDPMSRYSAAALRHMVAYMDGEVWDKDDGLSHLAHAACNIMFLMWFQKNRTSVKSESTLAEAHTTIGEMVPQEKSWSGKDGIFVQRSWLVEAAHAARMCQEHEEDKEMVKYWKRLAKQLGDSALEGTVIL